MTNKSYLSLHIKVLKMYKTYLSLYIKVLKMYNDNKVLFVIVHNVLKMYIDKLLSHSGEILFLSD